MVDWSVETLSSNNLSDGKIVRNRIEAISSGSEHKKMRCSNSSQTRAIRLNQLRTRAKFGTAMHNGVVTEWHCGMLLSHAENK